MGFEWSAWRRNAVSQRFFVINAYGCGSQITIRTEEIQEKCAFCAAIEPFSVQEHGNRHESITALAPPSP